MSSARFEDLMILSFQKCGGRWPIMILRRSSPKKEISLWKPSPKMRGGYPPNLEFLWWTSESSGPTCLERYRQVCSHEWWPSANGSRSVTGREGKKKLRKSALKPKREK